MIHLNREPLSCSGLGTSPSTGDKRKRDVEVTVYDKQIDAVQVFRCDLAILETSMAYFSPIIQRYIEEEDDDDGVEDEDEFHRREEVNVELHHRSRPLKPMKQRGDAAHPRSPVPLRVNCDVNIFAWLMAYVEGKQRALTPENAVSIALSSNFLLMKPLVDTSLEYIKDHLVRVMASGVNMSCLTGELIARLSSTLSDADLARAFLKIFEWRVEDSPNRRFLTALLRHVVCDRLSNGQTSSLRWCRLCGVLFDQQELQRAERSGKNVKPAICPKLSKDCIGVRGEILKTHVVSSHTVDLAIPSISWSDEHVERWAWRVIGSIYYLVCRRCNHLVFLIDTPEHTCQGGMSNFSSPDGFRRADAEALLAWYAIANGGLYNGGLEPFCSHQTDVPRECVLALTPTGEWGCDDGGERGTPGLWSTHPLAVRESVDAAGRVSLDALNGFERGLVSELQQVMHELGQPPAHGSRPQTPSAIPSTSPLSSPMRAPRQDASGRPQRPRETSAAATARQRNPLWSGSSPIPPSKGGRFLPEQTRSRIAAPLPPPPPSSTTHAKTPQAMKLSMHSLLNLGPVLGKRGSTTPQHQRSS